VHARPCRAPCFDRAASPDGRGRPRACARAGARPDGPTGRARRRAQADGERLPLVVKDLGSCDLYPQSLAHNPNGRFVTVCGDGEYIIYTALAWRNKSFGAALEFVWGDDSSVFATRESPSSVKLFRNFKEAAALRPDFAVEGLAGGALLSLRAPDFVVFYDWATAKARRAPRAPAPQPGLLEAGRAPAARVPC
jgi:hypothetical protein